MPFDAIVHAPKFVAGARVNIAEADQCESQAPCHLAVGAKVRLRFGVCCPDRTTGTIIDQQDEPARVVLAVGTEAWTLLRGDGGVTSAGLKSEHWYVED